MSPHWMPLYVADYLADTTHLSAAEHGAYLLLIMNYWQKGCLPKDEAILARICRMSSREWAKSRDVVAAMFGEGWTHHRIDSELEKARVKSEARAECGSRGGKAKALKDNDARLAIATDLPDENAAKAIASSSQFTSSLRSESSLRSDSAPPEKPKSVRGSRLPADWMPDEAGRSMAAEALGNSGARSELAKFRDWAAAASGAKGVKADWNAAWRNWVRKAVEDGKPRAGPPRPDPQEIRNPALRALQRLSQKNAQRSDDPDIFAAASDAGQRSPSDGSSSAETGDAPGRFGPVLNLAAYR